MKSLPLKGKTGGGGSGAPPGVFDVGQKLTVLGGTGSRADPFIGYYVSQTGNFNAASFIYEIGIGATPFCVIGIDKILAYYRAQTGVPPISVVPSVFMYSGLASTQYFIGEKKLVVFNDDCLTWEPDMEFKFVDRVEDGTLNGTNGHPYVQFDIGGYGSTDDFFVIIWLHWSVSE